MDCQSILWFLSVICPKKCHLFFSLMSKEYYQLFQKSQTLGNQAVFITAEYSYTILPFYLQHKKKARYLILEIIGYISLK